MDFKPGRKDYKSVQGFQIGAKRFQIGVKEISNRGRDYKSAQVLQIGVEQLWYCHIIALCLTIELTHPSTCDLLMRRINSLLKVNCQNLCKIE